MFRHYPGMCGKSPVECILCTQVAAGIVDPCNILDVSPPSNSQQLTPMSARAAAAAGKGAAAYSVSR